MSKKKKLKVHLNHPQIHDFLKNFKALRQLYTEKQRQKMTANFMSEISQIRGKWEDIIETLKRKSCQPRIL